MSFKLNAMKNFVLQVSAAAFIAAICLAAGAQTAPLAEKSFTPFVAEKLAKELPNCNIAVSARLTLGGKCAEGGELGEISLDRIFVYCNRNRDGCDAGVDDYVKGISEYVREQNRPVEKSAIRLSIRTREFVDQARKQMGKSISILARPLVADLFIVPVFDYPRSARFAGEKDLAALGLSEDELFKVGEQNLRTALRPLTQVAAIPVKNTMAHITGEDYAASRILLHDDWEYLAPKLNGNLLVMIPASDVVLFTEGSAPQAMDAIQVFGKEIARRASRPLSTLVLRWTKGGWEPVAPAP